MTSENTALAIDLTQAILEQFWQQDTSLLLKYIDEDFSLTDALNNSIIQILLSRVSSKYAISYQLRSVALSKAR